MRSFCPYEIVASIVRWSHDYVMCGQRFEPGFENRTRQVWAVAVEGDNASLTCVPLMIFLLMIGREVCKHRSEACSKTFTFLGNYAHLTARQLRQLVYVGVRAHDGNFHIPQ